MENHASEKVASPWKARIKTAGLVGIGVLLGLNLGGIYFKEHEEAIAIPVSSPGQVTGYPDYSSSFKALDHLVMVIETETGWGSGFSYSEDGFVITNAHVVTDGLEVTVWNSFGHPSEGTVVGISEFMDIALVHVPDYEGNEGVVVDTEAVIQPGKPILTISSPYENVNTGAFGYITGRERHLEMESASHFNQFIQFDAQIASGSSGGPLFDAQTNQVIGVITQSGGYYEEIKYALPIEDVVITVDRWMKQPLAEEDILTIQENLRELYEWDEEEWEDEE